MNQCVDILLSNADIIPYSAHYVYGTAKIKTDRRAFLYKIHFLGDAASSRVTCRRGETPHLLESSLIAICDRASNSKQHNKLRRFTKRLRYRCGMSFALLYRPHPTRRGGLSHGDAASIRVKFAALPKGGRRSAPDPLKLQPALHI